MSAFGGKADISDAAAKQKAPDIHQPLHTITLHYLCSDW